MGSVTRPLENHNAPFFAVLKLHSLVPLCRMLGAIFAIVGRLCEHSGQPARRDGRCGSDPINDIPYWGRDMSCAGIWLWGITNRGTSEQGFPPSKAFLESSNVG